MVQSLVKFDRLGTLLIDLLDQPDLPLSGQCFAKTLSAHLSSFLARQQSLFAKHAILDAHFYLVGSFKAKATDVTASLTDFNKWNDALKDQESALR